MSKTQRTSAPESEHQYVRTITPGMAVHTVLAVAEAVRKEARNGPFWIITLKDATGSLPGRIWSPLALQFEDIPAGRLVLVEGRAERYREQTQLSVSALRLLGDEETAALDTTAFMPASARSPLLMLEELEALADAVLTHAPWRDFMRRTLRDDDIRTRLLKTPAAKGIHHARVGGLLEHTLGVVRLCLRFAELYPQLDRQTLFAGAVCHDLGKLWELTSGLSTDYTDEGRLAGHIFLGLEQLRPHLEASGLGRDQVLHLQHLILSHHGEYSFGSPRLPQTAEALALHYADNMDAKMDQCRSLFSDMNPEDGAWSPYQKSLDRSVYRAPRTPLTPCVPQDECSVSDEATSGFARSDGPLPQDDTDDGTPRNALRQEEVLQKEILQKEILQDEMRQEDMPADDYPDAAPLDDYPDAAPLDDCPDAAPLDDYPDAAPLDDCPDDMPADDFPEDIPRGDFPDDFPEEHVAADDLDAEECVFEHLTDGNAIAAVMATAEEETSMAVAEDVTTVTDMEEAAGMAAVEEEAAIPDLDPIQPEQTQPEQTQPEQTQPEPQDNPAQNTSVQAEQVPTAKTRQQKTRLEVRQCSLL